MKLIDIKEGKVLGVNFVDLIAIALVLFLAFSFARTVLGEPLSFSGEEVYKAVKTYNKLESKGFLIEVEVQGSAIGDPTGKERKFQGLVVAARGGTLYIKNEFGDEFSVGGSMSYLEDVAAKEIKLMPIYSSSVSFYSKKEHFGSFREFLNQLEQLKENAGASSVVLTGEVSISQPEMGYLDVKKTVEDCFFCLNAKAYKIGDDLYMLSLKAVDLGELEKLDLKSGEVVAKNLRIYLGYDRELKAERVMQAELTSKKLGFLREVGEATYVSIDELL
jgi:hypothetical protein